MRILSLTIGLAVGVYIAWKVIAPLPVSAQPCLENADCAESSTPAAPPEALRPGLQIALYDPAIEPRLRGENEEPHASWTSPAELALTPGRPAGIKLSGLGQAGAHGVCIVLESGKRRCLAFIRADDELRATPQP